METKRFSLHYIEMTSGTGFVLSTPLFIRLPEVGVKESQS
jgi:hypothetical protein